MQNTKKNNDFPYTNSPIKDVIRRTLLIGITLKDHTTVRISVMPGLVEMIEAGISPTVEVSKLAGKHIKALTHYEPIFQYDSESNETLVTRQFGFLFGNRQHRIYEAFVRYSGRPIMSNLPIRILIRKGTGSSEKVHEQYI